MPIRALDLKLFLINMDSFMSVITAWIDFKLFRVSFNFILFVQSAGKRKRLLWVFQFPSVTKLIIQLRTIPGTLLSDYEKGKSLSFLAGPEMYSG